ncbi:AraC family transcriptional regulator [Roseibium aquae]|uniref:AraC family transcriptional regulator n=1 Tax=Roseibium aquae TaxID=1323746 RepID=A0A916TFP9_9HYPH|nr:helix-turn-helix domain-containing protein [Roseibium aquae]GGB42784.1 AraC family transcriptional regulator [Roseibium aquae]
MTSPSVIPRYHLYGEYDPPESFDFFHIEAIPVRSRPLGWQVEPHSHLHLHQAFLLTSGCGLLLDETGQQPVSPGHFVFVAAGALHGWTFSPDTEGHVLSFTADYLTPEGRGVHPLQLLGGAQPVPLLVRPDPADMARVRAYVREMEDEFGHGFGRRTVFKSLLTLVLARTLDPAGALPAREGGGPSSAGFSLFRFRSLIEEHFRQQRRPDFFAAAMGMPVARLNRHCRMFTDKTVAQVIRDRLILEAKRLLAYSRLSVSQIAYDLGYEDPAYFSRVFRKETGLSPLDFRDRHPGSNSGGESATD